MGYRNKTAIFIQNCLYLGPAKTMIEQKLMTILALIALSSIKINWFYQKIQSKYNRRKFQNFVFGPILEFGKIWFISVESPEYRTHRNRDRGSY